MLLDLLGINKVIKQIKCKLQKLENNTGGNYIPLTGTLIDKPVTGDIKFGNFNDDFKGLTAEIYGEDLKIGFNQQTGYIEIYTDAGKRFAFSSEGLYSDTDFSETNPRNKKGYAQRSYVNKANSYSTEETLTGGTWIDGKPIYRKTFVSVMPIPANIKVNIINEDLSSLNIENVFLEFISITQIDDETTYLDTSSFLQQNGNFDIASILLSYNNLRYITRTNYATTDLKVSLAIKYTKTTD